MASPDNKTVQGDGTASPEALQSGAALEAPDTPPDELVAEPPELSAEERRRAALEPLLDEFTEQVGATHESDPIPHFLELGGRPVELGLWERSVLKKSRDPRNRKAAQTLELLGEAVAFLANSGALLDRIERGQLPPVAELPSFQDRMTTDLAVGIVLEEQLQREVDRRIADGHLADAKALEGFKGNLTRCVIDLKDRVAPDQLELAERRAIELSGPQAVETDETPAERRAVDEEAEVSPWTNFKSRERELPPWLSEGTETTAEMAPTPSQTVSSGRRRSWLGPMLLVLAFLLVVYGVVMLPRAWKTELPVLTLDTFAHLDAVEGINARPPSLFVQLDGEAWDAGSAQDRLELLEEIGRIAGEWGYSGAHVRTDDGATVGQWLSHSGVRVIPRPPGPS